VIFVNASNSVRLSTAATVLLFSTLDHIAGYSADVVLGCLAKSAANI